MRTLQRGRSGVGVTREPHVVIFPLIVQPAAEPPKTVLKVHIGRGKDYAGLKQRVRLV